MRIKTPQLVDYQKKMIDSDKNTITEAGTKIGKTVSHMWWLFRESQQPHVQPGWNYWWVAPINEQAKIAFSRICAKIKGNPNYQIYNLSLIHISEPTRLLSISYAVF